MKRQIKNKPLALPAPTHYECETFRCITRGDMDTLSSSWKEPFCFNGKVGIRKWKVTAELIEEPKEVLIARLRELWKTCRNHHRCVPLRAEAAKLGIELS